MILEVFAAEKPEVESTNNTTTHRMVGIHSLIPLCVATAMELLFAMLSHSVCEIYLPHRTGDPKP